MSLRELRAAAASGRCRRHGISAAAAFAQTRVKGKSYSRQGVQGGATWESVSSSVILRERSDRRIYSYEILHFVQNDIEVPCHSERTQ